MITNYPNGVEGGIAIRNVPILSVHGGNVFWLDSDGGSDGNAGTFDHPFATLDYSIGKCTASNGDIIMIKPGHSETIGSAGAINFDVAGITVVGMGYGADRPTFNFTATASTILLAAAGSVFQNCLFTGGIDAVVTMFTVSAADCALVGCETKDVTGQMVSCITTTAAADRLLIKDYTHRGAAAAGGANCLEIVGGDGITVKNFWIDGNFSVAAIQNVTTAATNISIYGDKQCFARTRNAADVIVTMVATSTGNIGPNINARLQDNAANITEAFVGADMQFFLPINIANLDGEVGMAYNATASTDA